jgi:phage-related minor tail protein
MGLVGDIFVKLGLNVKDFQKGLKTAEANMKDVGEGFQKTGESMARAISLPLAGIGALALKGAIDVQKSQGTIQAQLGITSEEAEKLQGVVNNLFTDGFGGDMSEVQGAVSTVIRNMKELEGASTDTVQSVSKDTMLLAEVFDQDVNDISKSVNNMQQAFEGLSFKDSFDLITAGFQNGLDYSGEFLDTINEYSVHFETMGYSAKDMFDLFNEGAESGAFQLDKVGDLVKEMNIRLKDGSKSTSDAMGLLSTDTQKLQKRFAETGEGGKETFQAIMSELAEMEDQGKANEIGVALMGTQFEDLEFKAVQSLATMQNGLGDVEGATAKLDEAMHKDFGSVMIQAFREVTTALEPIGTEIGKLIQEYLPPLIEKVQGLTKWFTGLSSQSQVLVLALSGFAMILPFILIGVGALINSMGAIFGAMSGTIAIVGKVGGAFMKMKGALNLAKILPLITSPVGLIIAGIIALIAVGVLIWKNWDTIKAKAIEIWGSISSFFSETWSAISTGVSTFLTNIGTWFSEKWESIKTKTSEVFSAIGSFIVEWGLKLLSMTPIGMFVNFIIKHWDFIRDTTVLVFEMIAGIIRAIFLKIVEVVKPILTAYVNLVKTLWTKSFGITKSIFTALKNFFVSIWKSVLSFVTPILVKIANLVSKSWNKVKAITSTIFSVVKNTISTVFNNIRSKISSVASSVYSTVKSKFDSVRSAMLNPINKAKDGIKKAIDKIKGFFSRLKLKIPLPKVPKISVSKGTKSFLGQDIPYPKFSVNWNAKGNIFTKATVLGGGQGVAEAGNEIVMPIQHKRYMRPFVSNISEMLNDMQGEKSQGNIVNHFTISEMVVREEADIQRIADELERKQRKEDRAKGTLSFA